MNPDAFTLLVKLLEEAAGHLREVMDKRPSFAEKLKIRYYLPDELEGSAGMLRDYVKELTSDTANPSNKRRR